MSKKALDQCFLEIHVSEEGKPVRKKRIELSERETQLIFETLQNKRESGIDEDIEDIFS
ncbi:hypothetical protein ACFOU2_21365 [Bacillus songklensis]|uniref:Uncharacterized protein n=1 Tax=Bacillus songklensis TaxID=1069116 RepID=A0ABV8B9Q2_9BACI